MHRFIYEGVQLLGIGAGGFNDCPEKACMPFDKKRQGGVNAEGGGMLVIESLEHALARKAPKIYCEIVGFHQNADVDHASVPRQTNLFKAQKQAMIEAGITPSMLDMLSSHAASTIIGD
jgi:3-oxoacyl-[acyl-carrier-protein] synthase II